MTETTTIPSDSDDAIFDDERAGEIFGAMWKDRDVIDFDTDDGKALWSDAKQQIMALGYDEATTVSFMNEELSECEGSENSVGEEE